MSGVLQSTTTNPKIKSKKKGGKHLDAQVAPSKESSALPSPRNGPVDEHGDHAGEKDHIREVAKHIRNVNKKLNLMTKVDTIISENKGMSLDELVAAKKINADQKAQALKKPQLQAQLASFEEQLSLYRRLDAEYESTLAKEKEALESSHARELETTRANVKAEVKAEAERELKDKLLTFARFLAAAANRRNAGDEGSAEARAFEGALFLVYSGDYNAVTNALKLIEGSEEAVVNTDGSLGEVSFARVKELACEEIPLARSSPWDETATTHENTDTDPTIANAGLTELEDPTTLELANGTNHLNLEDATSAGPPTGGIDEGASNAAADSQWDPTKPGAQEDPLGESYEIIPRNLETESPAPGFENTRTLTQSWSEEMAESSAANGPTPPVDPKKTNGDDGFHEVKHHGTNRGRGGFRGGQRGDGSFHRGGFRGPRGGGGYRGDRGDRGDRGGFRGRGRGGRGRGD